MVCTSSTDDLFRVNKKKKEEEITVNTAVTKHTVSNSSTVDVVAI
jgi:hypothetical protein